LRKTSCNRPASPIRPSSAESICCLVNMEVASCGDCGLPVSTGPTWTGRVHLGKFAFHGRRVGLRLELCNLRVSDLRLPPAPVGGLGWPAGRMHTAPQKTQLSWGLPRPIAVGSASSGPRPGENPPDFVRAFAPLNPVGRRCCAAMGPRLSSSSALPGFVGGSWAVGA
jgi:hypothetical protein